jgi:type I restriction enzyme R subunit
MVGDIRETFKLPDFHILLVANKFQTGFDQPLLCGMYVDRRLAGIQAVQTLSRLNRAHPGKDTTYVLDFANNADEVLKAFKTYYDRAELENVTDPNLVFNLRAKLDALGYYDDHEVDRVVRAELNPDSKQSDLVAAIFPVADRLLRVYREGQQKVAEALARDDSKGARDTQDGLDALLLFRADMGAYVRLYAFLSQIFDYGNTDIEGRSIFYRRLIPLLEFGRQRETVDTSKVILTHHKLTRKDPSPMVLGMGEKLQAIYEAGAGTVQEKERALLAEIIAKVNDLFQGEVSDDDQLIYVNNVLKGKLLQSETLAEQAANNTKEQFSNSPDLAQAIVDAVIDAMDAHQSMSHQALGSLKVRDGLREVLLGPGRLYEALRERKSPGSHEGASY